jgi:calcineurin-like phosphoesterase family protein
MTDFFTADPHLGHHNIIKYCNRPFTDVDHMGTAIIGNINEVARETDRTFIIGDLANKEKYLEDFKKRVICKNIFVVPGNHDKEKILVRYFTVLPQCYMYRNGDFRIVLCHYAMRVWQHSHHGAGHLFGHSHSKLAGTHASMDIGVDCWDYKPVSLQEVKNEFSRRTKLLNSVSTTSESSSSNGEGIISRTFDSNTLRPWVFFPNPERSR